MVLLQAAMAGGFILIIFFGLFMLIGTPVLTIVLMRLYRGALAKRDKVKNEKAYYKDLIPFILILIFSIVALLLLFCVLIILFDIFFPAYGLSN